MANGARASRLPGQPTTFIVTFSQPMDAASAADLGNYQLVPAGQDHRFGTRDDHTIRLRSIVYDASSNTATIVPAHRLPLRSVFQLTIRGKQPAGLENAWGLFLDGSGNGQMGTDHVARITDKLLVPPVTRNTSKNRASVHADSH